MRIGIFSESYEPVLNGVTVSILTLTKELKRLGHHIWVFAPGYRGHKDIENRVFRFPSLRTYKARDYPLAIPYLPRLPERVKDLDLDIIHTHTPFMLGWLGLRLAKRLNIPIISTNHTWYTEYAHYFPLSPTAVTRSFIVRMLRRYYNQCDGVVVPSSPIAELLRGYGVHTPMHVIPTGNSLDTGRDSEARSRIRAECSIPADARVLLYVGRLAREKNLELLFEAFERLARKHGDVYLLVVGGGPYEAACRSAASKLQSGERIAFTGHLPRELVAKYYSAGDLFAFPSTTETQGLVLAEALGAGIPCVAVNAGGSPEMLADGEDSLLTEDDADDFTEKIDRLLTDRELMERFSARAVESSSRFSPYEMALRTLDAYESVRVQKRGAEAG
ncbi:MAG TPA: glycosyltransferase family 4 protein [Armatimonadota bacterium]|nr:glycosyltransferase family 4 protein [Armatimonadota bacterium]